MHKIFIRMAAVSVATLAITGCGGGGSSSGSTSPIDPTAPAAPYMPYGSLYSLVVMIERGMPAEYCTDYESVSYMYAGTYYIKTTTWSEVQGNDISCQDYGFGGPDIPSDIYTGYSYCTEVDVGLGSDTACVIISKAESI